MTFLEAFRAAKEPGVLIRRKSWLPNVWGCLEIEPGRAYANSHYCKLMWCPGYVESGVFAPRLIDIEATDWVIVS